MQTIGEALKKLQKSSFRSRFYLNEEEKGYVDEKIGEIETALATLDTGEGV